MFHLRRAITDIWTPRPQGNEGNDLEETISTHQHASPMITRDASSAGDRMPDSDHGNDTESPRRAEDQSSLPGAHGGTTQEILLKNPWGTHDPHPPPGWSTAAYGKRGASQHLSSAIETPNAMMTNYPPSSSSSSSVSILESGGDCRGEVIISPDRRYSSRSITKRRRNRDVSIFGGNFENEDQLIQDQRDHREQQADESQAIRRYHQTDRCFVSPVKASHPKLVDDEDDPDCLNFQRPFPPLRFTFRAGLAKDLIARKRKGATQGATTNSRTNRTRSIDSIARDVYEAMHASLKEDEEPKKEEENDEKRAQILREWQARDKEVADAWRRIKQLNEDNLKRIEEKASYRQRRMDILDARAEAVMEDARRAKNDLMVSAKIALEAVPVPDMPTLRSLFVGSAAPGVQFKNDSDVSKLRLQFHEMEDLLRKIKAARSAGNLSEMEILLSSAGASRLKNHPELVLAHEVLRSAKDREAKAAEDARAAATSVAVVTMAVAPISATAVAPIPATAVAPISATAVAPISATAVAGAPSVAIAPSDGTRAASVPVPIDQASERTGPREVENRAGPPAFLDRSEELKRLVKEKRAVNDQLLSSSDPVVAKMRLGFKKAYQGSLNKLSPDPASVKRVFHDIAEKAGVPFSEARNGGYEDSAREFFLFNLAEKLVSYAERDHFSAESYKIALPLASLVVDLTAEHKLLSELFLGWLYSKCPAAIPMLSFDTAGKSDAEVMLLCGMREEESMSTYLTRTKGLIVLMAAVMQTPPSVSGRLPHPLPLEEGWRWLARLLNSLEDYVKRGCPPPPATGPVLEWFLKIAGFELQKRCGNWVSAVVQAIKTELLPILLPKSKVPHLLDVVIDDFESQGRRFLRPKTGV